MQLNGCRENLAYLEKCTSCTVPQVVREILFIAVAAAGTIPVLVIAFLLLALTPCSLDNSISIAAALKRTSVAVDARLSLLRKRALDTANSDKTKDAVLHRRDVGAPDRSIIGMRNAGIICFPPSPQRR